MIAFYRKYPASQTILPQAVAKLPEQPLLAGIPWGHHCLLLEKIKDIPVRFWYMEQTAKNGWNRDTLAAMIKSDQYSRQGSLANNFGKTLAMPQSELVRQALKDPYIFDFLTLTEPFAERELETELIICGYAVSLSSNSKKVSSNRNMPER